VNVVLTILDELDSYVFERIDSSSANLETMSGRLFGHSQFFGHEELLLHTLCDWAVSSMRSGEHRAFVVAKLLERRQAKLVQESAHVAANSSASVEPASSSIAAGAATGRRIERFRSLH
jgi:mediator of RNA polymerase II transcription subunit 12